MTPKAVLLDALGTLLELLPPWPRLAAALGDGVPENRVRDAFRSEMSYYRAHSHEARDPASLAALRARCAEILSAGLGQRVEVETMMASIRFRPFADAELALAALRERDLRVVCVSNWDYALGEVLARCGLAGSLDAVVTSASVGAPKPEGAIFEAALEAAGCAASEAVHVGDSPREDADGARAAGIAALLIDRGAETGSPNGPGSAEATEPGRITSLTQIVDHLER